MNNHTFIIGKNGSGKTTLLKALTERKNTAFLNSIDELNKAFSPSQINKFTEIIAIDEAKLEKKKVIEKIKSLITCHKMVVNKKGEGAFTIDMPKLIITSTDCTPDAVFKISERFNVIECHKK